MPLAHTYKCHSSVEPSDPEVHRDTTCSDMGQHAVSMQSLIGGLQEGDK